MGGVDEQPLRGGVANAGQVTRTGNWVLRPTNPHSPSIHRFLRHVRAAGLAGVPRVVGPAPDGRERLEFIEGDVPLAPYPEWAQRDEAVASIAALLRRLHEAGVGFPSTGLTWSDELLDPRGGTVVCHNDVCLENVVFRDGRAVALLDFDFAGPGRPLYDLATFAKMCVPVDDDVSAARLGWRPADRPARVRLVADAYGLDVMGRQDFLGCLDDAIEIGARFVRRRVEAGDANFIAMWEAVGGEQRYARRRRWWADHRAEFAASLR
jgi:aminoglycoside phosphotransferase (APT) family kinase protein